MVEAAERIARACGVADVRAAREAGTLSLGFHLWPFLSVYHLHLHLIFPILAYLAPLLALMACSSVPAEDDIYATPDDDGVEAPLEHVELLRQLRVVRQHPLLEVALPRVQELALLHVAAYTVLFTAAGSSEM